MIDKPKEIHKIQKLNQMLNALEHSGINFTNSIYMLTGLLHDSIKKLAMKLKM